MHRKQIALLKIYLSIIIFPGWHNSNRSLDKGKICHIEKEAAIVIIKDWVHKGMTVCFRSFIIATLLTS